MKSTVLRVNGVLTTAASASPTRVEGGKQRMQGVIDMHTHLACEAWVDLLRGGGAPHFELTQRDGRTLILTGGQVFAPILPELLRFDNRLAEMDRAGIDIAVLSLTAPGVTWGTSKVARKASQVVNDDLARACDQQPDRFRWLASLPMHLPELAVKELARCDGLGPIGVIVMANVLGRPLTHPDFAPVWEELNARRMLILLHPTIPPGAREMGLADYHLMGLLGLMFDTSIAVARMIFDGFLERYPDLRLIIPHSGATLPFLSSRLDHGYSMFPKCRENIPEPPTRYFTRMYFDDANSSAESISMCASFAGEDRMLHGSDYPFVPMDKSLVTFGKLAPSLQARLARENARALLQSG